LPTSTRESVFAVTAGFLGWALDAFDFFLVVIALPRIAADFQVKEPAIAASLTLTLMFRPVGAFIFGLLADRYGRRIPMMIDLVFFSMIEVATGFAPNLATFLVLRALFGIGMGGEWGVGTSLVMEKVPPKWRGVLSGFLQQGYSAGYLLSAVAAFFMLDRFGWRPMFFLGGAPALLALFIRFAIKESDVWQKTKAESWSQLGRGIASHWKQWIYLTILMAMMNFSSHGTQDMYPTFLQRQRMYTPSDTATITMISMIGAVLGGLAFGHYSDRSGRRRSIATALVGALIVVPLWIAAPNTALIVAGVFLMQFFVQGAWGVIPAHINELSPGHLRGFFPGFAYQLGVLVASSITYIESLLGEHFTYAQSMGVLATLVVIGGAIVALVGPEAHGVSFRKAATPEGAASAV
jgi:SHS family lactate transporter-like MFS transporter